MNRLYTSFIIHTYNIIQQALAKCSAPRVTQKVRACGLVLRVGTSDKRQSCSSDKNQCRISASGERVDSGTCP